MALGRITNPLQLDMCVLAEDSRVPAEFHGMEFASDVSPKNLYIDDAVAHAAKHVNSNGNSAVLANLPQEAAITAEARGKGLGTNTYRTTSSGVGFFYRNGVWQFAVDHDANPANNILLTRNASMGKTNKGGNLYIVPASESDIALFVERALDEKKAVPVPDNNWPYSVSVNGGSTSKAANDVIAQKFFGAMSPAYATMLEELGYSDLRVYLAGKGFLSANVGNDNVFVRPVGLGNVINLSIVSADDYLGIIYGRARAVAPKKISETSRTE